MQPQFFVLRVLIRYKARPINPFTAAACKISVLKKKEKKKEKKKKVSTHTRLQIVSLFDGPITNLIFSTVQFDRNPFGCSCKGAKKP